MANIIQNQMQANACIEINKALAEVRILNEALADPARHFEIPLDRKKVIKIDPALNSKLVVLLKSQRTKLIKEILAKADKHHIELDENDKQTISDAPAP